MVAEEYKRIENLWHDKTKIEKRKNVKNKCSYAKTTKKNLTVT